MRVREGVMAAAIVAVVLAAGCTGGKESAAAEEQIPQKNAISPEQGTATVVASSQPAANPSWQQDIKSIGDAIPVYAGAQYRDDLTHRDAVMVRNQFGPNAKVYTLATDDSYPQVYHYYTTYLAQFRAYDPQPPYPPQQNWRTLEVQLNQAMQEPFIPGDALKSPDKQVTLQVAETEAEPKTVIRYIITPANATASAPASKAVAAK